MSRTSLEKGALGVLFGWMAVIGSAIGMGIMRMPHDVARSLPDPLLYFGMWILCALFVVLCIPALCELAGMLGRSGGPCVFARHAYGPFAGFLVGYMDWLTWCGGMALISIVAAEEILGLFAIEALSKEALAVAICVGFSSFAFLGLSWGGRMLVVTSVLKALGLLVLAALIAALADPPASAASGPGSLSLFGVVIAFQAVIFAFAGWEAPIYMAEEIGDPKRSLPRSALIGTLSVIFLYLGVNFALVAVMPLSAVAEETLPVAAAAGLALGELGKTVVTVVAILIMFGTIASGVLVAPRIIYALGSDGLFSSAVTRVSERGAPTVATALSGAVTVLLIVTGGFDLLLTVLGLFYVLNVIIAQSAVLVLRLREPERARPYRAFGYPLTPLAACVFGIAFLVAAAIGSPESALYGLIALLACVPFYLAVSRGRKRGQGTAA